MKNRNSYAIDSFDFRSAEAKLLEKRASFRVEEFEKALADIRVSKRGCILEIGSGTGVRANLLARRYSGSRVLGVDVSEEMVNRASARYANVRNLSFERQDVFEFARKRKSIFELIYLRLVLQHVPEPLVLLRACYRMLKKGGTLLIEDVDRQVMHFTHSNGEWERYYALAMDAHKARGGDPYIGRKIHELLIQSNFSSIENRSYLHFGDSRFFKGWARDFAPSYFNNLKSADRTKALRVLEKLAADEKARAFTQLWFFYRAKK